MFRIQAGQYTEAFAILEERVKYEQEQLGQRPDELADVYQAMAKCKSEVCWYIGPVKLGVWEQAKGLNVIFHVSHSFSFRLKDFLHKQISNFWNPHFITVNGQNIVWI